MTKLLLGGLLLFAGAFQEPGSIAGKVVLQSSGDGISEVAITLCPDTGRQVVSLTDGSTGIPPRDQVREIRIPSPNAPGPITITSEFTDCPNARRTTTDNTGSFIISEVASGLYKVYAQRNGYVGQPRRESFRDGPREVVSQSVNSARRTVTDISLSLIKAGTIAGTVRDTNGEPVVSAIVEVRRDGFPLVSKVSDDRGQYRLFWLPPGEFALAVRPSGPPGQKQWLASTQYPKTIVLREGEEVSGIDVVVPLP